MNATVKTEPLLRLDGISKSFGTTQVLSGATFSVDRGEVVALVGENGAGKSTLKNIICGLLQPSSGTLTANGRVYQSFTPEIARSLGIAAIHQELSLFPNLSVAENMHIGVNSMPMHGGILSWDAMREQTVRELRDYFDQEIDVDQTVGEMSLGQRQLVEVAKATHRASNMLIFDEPTTSLSLPERQRLFDVVRKLRGNGFGIIYITHFLEEIYALSDKIVVLRDGRVVGTEATDKLAREDLVKMMVGRELSAVDEAVADDQASVPDSIRPIVLRVSGVSDGELLHDISLELRAGEVVGIGGLMGAGRTELAQAIFGVRSATGTVEIKGQEFSGRSPATAKARGIALVSEDRRAEQVFGMRGVDENVTSTILEKLVGKFGLFSRKARQQRALELCDRYGVKYASLDTPMHNLSGGNQQKCILARWLSDGPTVCILDEPTKGIDVNAKAEVHLLIRKLAAEGLGVLLISSDLPELMTLSHRILVMHKGTIVGQFSRPDFEAGSIVRMASLGRAA